MNKWYKSTYSIHMFHCIRCGKGVLDCRKKENTVLGYFNLCPDCLELRELHKQGLDDITNSNYNKAKNLIEIWGKKIFE